MISLVVALLAAPAPSSLPAVVEPEIVVVAKRLDQVQVNVTRSSDDRLHCGLTGSSGSPKLDSRLCEASANCVRRLGKRGYEAVSRCILQGKRSLVRQFRAEWLRRRGR